MKANVWIAKFLADKGITDVFGIPGVVVMDLLYGFDSEKPKITPHLNYHEQGASFAACGYAQATGKLGVAYATRGPGFTNMLTAMADAYYDATPTMFFTAHSQTDLDPDMRVLNNQEIDTVALARPVTKRAVRINDIRSLCDELAECYELATTGRKGPVFLDILSSVFTQEIPEDKTIDLTQTHTRDLPMLQNDAECIAEMVQHSKRPVILVGNGARYDNDSKLICCLAEKFNIPILSSRTAQDIVAGDMYYGFIGSRATRQSNFILSKADLILALGNRMSFPINSKSFRPVVESTHTIRIDIDEAEFRRDVPNSTNFHYALGEILPYLLKQNLHYYEAEKWIEVCNKIQKKLKSWDESPVIRTIMGVIQMTTEDMALVCDVGNHSFWVTTAYSYAECRNRILYSGSFGTLGCALPKAIGACYSTGRPCVCFTGDQGLQMNIQELQFLAQHKLPVTIVLLNNQSSGMIMEREAARYGNYFVHTTMDSGYSFPNYKLVAEAYGLRYYAVEAGSHNFDFSMEAGPMLIEVLIDPSTSLYPMLPQGKPCQDLYPYLPRDLYEKINQL